MIEISTFPTLFPRGVSMSLSRKADVYILYIFHLIYVSTCAYQQNVLKQNTLNKGYHLKRTIQKNTTYTQIYVRIYIFTLIAKDKNIITLIIMHTEQKAALISPCRKSPSYFNTDTKH